MPQRLALDTIRSVVQDLHPNPPSRKSKKNKKIFRQGSTEKASKSKWEQEITILHSEIKSPLRTFRTIIQIGFFLL
jgi:hypothetical protein